MTTVTPALVKALRQRSGVGILECQKALKAANGDIDAAFEALRKSGQAKAAKKAGNTAAEGLVAVELSADGSAAAIIEVNCQTDFAARNESFIAFTQKLLGIALTLEAEKVSVDTLSSCPFGDEGTVEEARQALIAKIGENIKIGRVQHVKAKGKLSAYLHGTRIAVLVDLIGGDDALGKDIAMHIAASRPIVVAADDIPAELLDKEREIYKAQMVNANKPEAVLAKIIEGKLQKYINEACLLGQSFVKDTDKTIAAVLKAANASVNAFMRYEVGEEAEPKQGE